jgi:hypothetical protein
MNGPKSPGKIGRTDTDVNENVLFMEQLERQEAFAGACFRGKIFTSQLFSPPSPRAQWKFVL